MYTKSTFGIIAALLLLVGVGVAYAAWTETLKINVTVNTGEVFVEWSSWKSNDTYEKPNLDVTKVYVEPEKNSTEPGHETAVIKLNVTIDNAYPSYAVKISGNVSNTGTIPVDFDSAALNVSGTIIPLSLCNVEDLDFDNDGVPEINVHLILNEQFGDGEQIDPGEYDTYELDIHIKQAAKELATYEFEVELTFIQWNEA